jgi:hypothetical protein
MDNGMNQTICGRNFCGIVLISISCFATTSFAVETVTIEQNGKTQTIVGKVLVEALDGGMLLLADDGAQWMLQPNEIKDRKHDEKPFEPLTPEKLEDRLLAEMPDGFRVHRTAHYTICYNTSKSYAEWCGQLYERLYRAFFNYWKTRGWELSDPEFPLVALVFDTRQAFADYGRPELGDTVDNIIGYYNMRTNRVYMYDLTGADGIKRVAPRIRDTALISQILMQPGAERTVATIVHEATHQIAYNCGMQVRFADNPFWVSEGLAVFFESPDVDNSRGWKTVGVVNQVHLYNFHKFLRSRAADSLETLLSTDERFHDPKKAGDAYSEAWALNYFLLNRRKKQYVTYLKKLAEKPPLLQEAPEERMSLFKEVFGDIEELDKDFVEYILRVKQQ